MNKNVARSINIISRLFSCEWGEVSPFASIDGQMYPVISLFNKNDGNDHAFYAVITSRRYWRLQVHLVRVKLTGSRFLPTFYEHEIKRIADGFTRIDILECYKGEWTFSHLVAAHGTTSHPRTILNPERRPRPEFSYENVTVIEPR